MEKILKMNAQVEARLRVATLREYQVLDTEAELEFDELTKLAAEICQTPICAISLLDYDRQWFKSKVGLEVSETSLECSFCKVTALGDNLMEVCDATSDERFKNNPLVTSIPNIRFYAGAPLIAYNGQKIGALCVIDTKPRILTEMQKNALETLAKQVMTALELRKINIELAAKNLYLQRAMAAEVESLRQTLAIVKQREQELELATNTAAVGIWEWELSTDKIRMSQIEKEILGIPLTQETVTYEHFENTVHPDDLAELEATLADVIIHGIAYHSEFRVIKRGEIRWLSASGKVLYDEAGRALRMVGVNTDITAFKQHKLENEQLQINERAALEASQLKTEFLANMSHEIRTPINGIIGMTKLLLQESLTPDQRQFAESINKSSNILLVLINDILDLTKIEAGKLDLEIIPFSLEKMLLDVHDCFSPLAKEKGLTLNITDATKSKSLYMGDPSRIRQVLNNLIGNALKFTRDGHIDIKVHSAKNKDDSLELEFFVSDSGIGIPSHAQENLFTSFNQADSSMARKFGGSGLGLAICKKLVNLMNGDISVDSKVGLGSTFTFTVNCHEIHPSKVPMTDHKETSSDYSPAHREKFKILVAEDNMINQEVVLRLLSKMGYKADAVSNGHEAISAMEAINYDLILMDCQMPEMDGYEASQRLREKGFKLPIIALTANAFKEDKEKCLAAGMTDYLTKPINFTALIQFIDRELIEKNPSHQGPAVITIKASSLKEKSIDHAIIDRLRYLDEDGSEGLIPKIINMFLEMTPEALVGLRAASIKADPALPKKAHALKSSCANLGAKKMVAILQAIENGSIDANFIGDKVDELDEEYKDVKNELIQILGKS